MLSVFLALTVAAAIIGSRHRDHFWSESLDGDPGWYQARSRYGRLEMQGREIFFHGIGETIANLRRADIILLGNSILEFGLDWRQMQRFQEETGIRIFNMNMPGLASGEFLRRVIRKFGIQPKLWIVNANDFPAEFFASDITDRFMTGPAAADRIVLESRLKSYARVAGRNMRWRVKSLLDKALPAGLRYLVIDANPMSDTWRSAIDGNQFFDRAPTYAQAHDNIRLLRDQNCPADDALEQKARAYLSGIGGRAVLMQVPFERWCPQRVRELAQRLRVSAITPDHIEFSVLDGTHMDQAGAIAFTAIFLRQLRRTPEFAALSPSASKTGIAP